MSPRLPRKAALLPTLLALAMALAGCHGMMDNNDDSAPDEEASGGRPAANTGGARPPTPPPSPPPSPAPPPSPSPPPAPPQNDDDDEDDDDEADEEEDEENPGQPPAPINATIRDAALSANESIEISLQVPNGYKTTTAFAQLESDGQGNATGTLRLLGPDGEILGEEAWTLPLNGSLESQVIRNHPDTAPSGTYTARLTVETGAVWVKTLRIEATAP